MTRAISQWEAVSHMPQTAGLQAFITHCIAAVRRLLERMLPLSWKLGWSIVRRAPSPKMHEDGQMADPSVVKSTGGAEQRKKVETE